MKVREIQNTEGKIKVLYGSRLVHRYGCWTVREFLLTPLHFIGEQKAVTSLGYEKGQWKWGPEVGK